MKSILLAGGAITPNDPLFDYRQYGTKGLIPINGKPMVQWVLDALCQSRAVDEIFIMGLDQSAGLVSSRPLVFLPGQESLFENIGTALQLFTRHLEKMRPSFWPPAIFLL